MVGMTTSNASAITNTDDANAARPRKRLGKKEKLKLRIEDDVEPEEASSTIEGIQINPAKDKKKVDKGNWSWMPLVDSHSSTCPILFSKDSKHSFVAVGASVKIYSVATAQLLSTLSIPNLSTQTSDGSLRRTKVSCLLLNPANSLQLIVGSLDGMLRLWDYKEGKLIRTLDLGSPIQLACSHPAILDQIFVAIVSSDETVEGVIEGRKKNSSSESVEMAGIYAISLKPKALATGSTASASTPRSPARRMRLAKPRVVTALGVSSSGTFLIAVNPRQINLCNLKQIQRGFASRIESKDNLTCLAFHPTENYFATGNDKGQIRLWYGVLEEGNAWEAAIKLGTSKSQSGPGSTSVFHWHAHAVTALAFTPNGAYLMSGGEEAVLVLWQLHTGHQEFVPRLGSPILTLSINDSPEQEQQVAARLRDGTVVFIGSQKLKVSKTISGIKADPIRLADSFSDRSAKIPLGVQPTTKHLVLPSGHPSSLQFYSLADDTQSLEVEVSPSNRVSAIGATAIKPTRVELVAFSTPSTSTGKEAGSYWMATLDTWVNGTFAAERHIKFWRHSAEGEGFELTTRIDAPHEDVITSMTFSPSSSSPLLLTTSLDSTIKVWSYSGSSWHCRSSSSYRSFAPLDGAWSHDGSMFAVAHPTAITLWSLASNSLIHAFNCGSMGPARKVEFIGEEGTMLLAGGKHGTTVWDLLTFEGTSTTFRAFLHVQVSLFRDHFGLTPALRTETLNMGFVLNEITIQPKTSLFVATESSSSSYSSSMSSAAARPADFTNHTASNASTAFIINAKTHSCANRSLPFPIRQSVWLDSQRPSSVSFSAVSLVVVNAEGEILLIGENGFGSVGTGESDGGGEKQVLGLGASKLPTSGMGQSRLFDEIFGVAILPSSSTSSSSLAPSSSYVTGIQSGGGGKGKGRGEASSLEILDAPAHTLPPARLLWKSMLGEFATLKVAPPSVTADAIDEDVEMEEGTTSLNKVGGSQTKLESSGGDVRAAYSTTSKDGIALALRTHLMFVGV